MASLFVFGMLIGMNQLLRILAYVILSLPMMLVHQAAQNIWGQGTVGFLAFLALFALDFLIATTVHEAGHALAAHQLGWRISHFAVFPVSYNFRRRKFSLWTRPSGDLGGEVGIIPLPDKTRRQIAIIWFAGPAFNFLLIVALTPLASILPPQFADIVGSVTAMSLLMGIGNLLPWTTRNGARSDGAVLLSLISGKQKTAKRRI